MDQDIYAILESTVRCTEEALNQEANGNEESMYYSMAGLSKFAVVS